MNRNDIERSNYLVNIKNAFRLKYNAFLLCYIFLIVIAYSFFFSSNIWMPTDSSSVHATQINSVTEWNEREITLLSWKYSQAEDKMEIILNVKNKSFDDYNDYVYSAFYIQKTAKHKVTEIINEKNLIVLELEDIPHDFGAVCIHFGISDRNYTKLYATSDSVTNVASIEKLDFNGYMISQLNSTIEIYESYISEYKSEIDEYTNTIEIANNKIEEYQNESTHQTSQELGQTEEEIKDALNVIDKSEEAIKDCNTLISEYKQRIANLKEEIKEYEDN